MERSQPVHRRLDGHWLQGVSQTRHATQKTSSESQGQELGWLGGIKMRPTVPEVRAETGGVSKSARLGEAEVGRQGRWKKEI